MAQPARKPLSFDVDRSPATAAELAKKPKPTPAAEALQQIGTRVSPAIYRELKMRAASEGMKVQELVGLAITEYLANHPG